MYNEGKKQCKHLYQQRTHFAVIDLHEIYDAEVVNAKVISDHLGVEGKWIGTILQQLENLGIIVLVHGSERGSSMDRFDWQAFVDCIKNALYRDSLQNILDYAEMGNPVVCLVCKREIVDEGHHVRCPLKQIQVGIVS